VRKDLPPGAQLAQSVHVAFRFASDYRHATHQWMDESEYICILAAENEAELIELLRQSKELNIRLSVFNEPDYNNSLTAIALEPSYESKRLCSKLKLALKEP
jgi:peptidyl-tRNA hydrolase